MAIINCPECGEKISDRVSQCVHCGVQINICPECGKIYTESVTMCRECGYELEGNNVKIARKNNVELKTSKEVISKWENQNALSKFLSFSNVVWIVLILAVAVFLGMAVIKLLTWDDVLNSNETFSSIKTLLIVSALFYVAQCAFVTLAEYNKVVMISAWCVGHKVDLESVIGNTLKSDFDTMTLEQASTELSAAQWCIRSAAYAKDAIMRENIKKYNTIKICLSIVFVILFVIFCIENIEIYMQAEIFKSELLGISGFDFGMIEKWWILIAAVVVYIINYFLSKHIDKIDEKASKKYVNKNMPAFVEKYDKYVNAKNMAEYVLQRTEKASK